ncbi:MAG: nitroreductase family protein [Bacteroidales bacterium]
MKPENINPGIRERRSHVIFSPESLSHEIILLLVEAARWAPSSFNRQPWRFIYARREEKDEWLPMFDLLLPGNREWVQHHVPVLMMTLAEMVPSGRKESNIYAWHDVGLATSHLLVQAASMGLATHPMGGFDREKAMEAMHIPEPFRPVAMLALGYPGRQEDVPEELVQRDRKERTRNPLGSMVFRGRWGTGFWSEPDSEFNVDPS